MNNFQKSQANKILSCYSNVEDILEKAHPVGYVNKYGRQKQADGSWKYVGKNKANQAAPKSSGREKLTQNTSKKSSKTEGVDPKDFADIIAKDKAEGKFPLGFVKVNDPSSPLHDKYFKVAGIRVGGTQIYVGGKKLKDRLSKEQISERVRPADIAKQAAANKEKETQVEAIDKLGAELDNRGVEYRKDSRGNIQIQLNGDAFVTILPRKDGKYIVNTTSGTIENPSKALNATWYGSDPKSLDGILDRYGKKQEAPKKESTKPAAPKKITKFEKKEVESELKGFLKSGMKIADIDIDKDGKSFTAYIDTDVRGPRTDHGGGSDGDGWMSNEQVEKLRKTYGKPFEPTLDKIKNEFGKRFKGAIKGQVDYGEKGHVGLYISGQLS